jgi:hypothetical protein
MPSVFWHLRFCLNSIQRKLIETPRYLVMTWEGMRGEAKRGCTYSLSDFLLVFYKR